MNQEPNEKGRVVVGGRLLLCSESGREKGQSEIQLVEEKGVAVVGGGLGNKKATNFPFLLFFFLYIFNSLFYTALCCVQDYLEGSGEF